MLHIQSIHLQVLPSSTFKIYHWLTSSHHSSSSHGRLPCNSSEGLLTWPLLLLSPPSSPVSAQQPAWPWQEAEGISLSSAQNLPGAAAAIAAGSYSPPSLPPLLTCMPSLPHPPASMWKGSSQRPPQLLPAGQPPCRVFLPDACYQLSLYSDFSSWLLPVSPMNFSDTKAGIRALFGWSQTSAESSPCRARRSLRMLSRHLGMGRDPSPHSSARTA